MSAVIVDDEVVHYEVLGRGRPLILIHGWLGSWRYWIPTMQVLSGEFRIYALDLWGFGDSSKRRDRYSLEAQAELVRGFMDRMAILKAAFVGHGLGGAVVTQFMRQYPDLADRAMTVCVPLTARALDSRLTSTPLTTLIENFLGKNPSADPVGKEAMKTDPLAVEVSVKALLEHDLRDTVRDMHSTLLLVYGSKDQLVTPPDEQTFAGIHGNIHMIELEESRHFPMLDETPKFNRLLLDFLALKSGEDLNNLELKEEWKRRVR